MKKVLKIKARKILLKTINKYPYYYKIHSLINKNVIIFNPFMKTEIKWRKLKKLDKDFEINKILFNKGLLDKKNILFDVKIKQGKKIDKNKKNNCGNFTVKLQTGGIIVKGKLVEKNRLIIIKVNSVEVKKINLKERRTFRFILRTDILKNFPEKSIITIEAKNEYLRFNNSFEAVVNIPFTEKALHKKMEKDFFINKKGGVFYKDQSNDLKYDNLLNLYTKVKKIFEKEIGKDLFITYGTLLGYVREGDFLHNDDDFDCGYISNEDNTKKVKKETLHIVKVLLMSGYNIRINQHGKLFKVRDNNGVELDLVPIWFKDDLSVLYRGAACEANVKDFLPAKKRLLRNYEILIPNNSNIFLSGYYGDNWKIPDPGYISYSKQTGICLKKEYRKSLITPFEYKQYINNKNLRDIKSGNFKSSVNF